MAKSLFEKYGGQATISELVHEFYRKVLADDHLAPLFENTSMEKLKNHQEKFLGFALGGPDDYKGRDMASAHRHLHLKEVHFNLVAGYLEEVLSEAGIADQDIDTIMAIVGSTKEHIVTNKAA